MVHQSKLFVRIEEEFMPRYLGYLPWTAGQGKVARLICDVYTTDTLCW